MYLAQYDWGAHKFQAIEIKPDSSITRGGDPKTRGEKMKDSLAMLLKTNGENLSVYGLLAMFMKINRLYLLSRDVDENEGDI